MQRTTAESAPTGDLAEVARALVNAVEGEVRFGLHDRMLYATDASLYQVEPLGVVIPSSVEDALRAVRACAAMSVPMLPRAGGTSLAGQCVNRAVVIDMFAHCNAVGEVDGAARTVRVEPGATIEQINAELACRGVGLFFAPDPATLRQAGIGGVIGNNAAGARSILYGRTSENLEAVECALATGERVVLEKGAALRDPRVREITRAVADVVQRNAALIRERFPKTVRRNAGYNLDLVLQQLEGEGVYAGGRGEENVNLAHLLCGSEGTLAVTLGATLRLHPVPAARCLSVVSFDTLDAAIDAVGPILTTRPSAVELLDDMVLALAAGNTECSKHVELLPRREGMIVRAVLYVEHSAERDAHELDVRVAALREVVGDAPMRTHTDARAMLGAWRLRQAGEPLLHGLPGERKPITFVEDNAVPVERLGEFVRSMRDVFARHDTTGAFYAHASVGVLHVRPLLSLRDAQDRERMVAIAQDAAELARSLGGVMSGEHGDGRARGPLLERFYGPELMRAFREVKRIFDPNNLLNPGMIVEPGPVESIAATLRIDAQRAGGAETPRDDQSGAHTHTARPYLDGVDTYFEYGAQHGFRGAVEACNGAGLCRKTDSGVMCPSYMALRDERHSTRGRANALRLAITGQLGADASRPAWEDDETLRTLDLCLSCKACKAECPSNVDVARLKSEFLAQRGRAGVAPPLRERLLAEVRVLNRIASLAPALANALGGLRIVRALMGVDARRSLPRVENSLRAQLRETGWSANGLFSPSPSGRGQGEGSSAPVTTSSGGTGVPPVFSQSTSSPHVALFLDCFTDVNEPRIGLDAIRVLEALGYGVTVVDAGCCARPHISGGLLDRARSVVNNTLTRLRPFIEDENVAAIVVLEPSCLAAFADDWLALKVDAPLELREALARKATTIERFVHERWDDHPVPPRMRDSAQGTHVGDVVLHPHCHQRALWGEESTAALLERFAPGRVRTLDAGCCGMAGAFGYAPHRYDLSMRIAERALLPACREVHSDGGSRPEASIVAPGTSCRHQIKDGASVRALHPAEWLARMLPPHERPTP